LKNNQKLYKKKYKIFSFVLIVMYHFMMKRKINLYAPPETSKEQIKELGNRKIELY